MKAYSVDFRQKIVDAYENKEGSIRQVAKRFKVAPSFVQKLLKRYQEVESLSPLPHGGGFSSKLVGKIDVIEQLLDEKNDATLKELSQGFQKKTGIQVSSSTICRALQKLKLTRKKKHCTQLKQKVSESNGCG
jgi:transposase